MRLLFADLRLWSHCLVIVASRPIRDLHRQQKTRSKVGLWATKLSDLRSHHWLYVLLLPTKHQEQTSKQEAHFRSE